MKPTVESLGIDLSAQDWRQPPGDDGDGLEVAMVGEPAQWVLLRVAGDPDQRVLVYDRNEWDCFLDGARAGEFDGAGGEA